MFAVLVALLQSAQPAAAGVQQAPAAQSVQQLFDAATEAASDGRCADALPIFAQLESRPAIARNELARAALDVRRGTCLIEVGRLEEGEAAVRRGLPTIAAKGESFVDEVRQAHLSLGRLAALRFDFTASAAEYEKALALSQGDGRIRPLMMLSQILAFDGDGRAVRYAREARDLALADPSVRKRERAAVQTQYARALLNDGQLKEAYAELKDSLSKQGGLDSSVNLSDLATRSDLAIAASLNKDHEAARKYLAYTGAGRFRDTPFSSAAEMQAPPCGSTSGLKPDDFAIVEFSISDDGYVRVAMPVYTTGGRQAAIAFARAASGWSWDPEVVKGIPPLFRLATRVEMRCTMTADRPSPVAPLGEAYGVWLARQGATGTEWSGLSDARALPLQRAAEEKSKDGANPTLEIQALVGIGGNSVASASDQQWALGKALSRAETMKAPVDAQTYIAIRAARARSENSREERQALRSLLARPEVAASPLSASTLRLLIAAPANRLRSPEDAGVLLAAVSNEPGLPEGHPLKVAALLQQADLYAANNDLQNAQQMFEKTGLTSEQCAFLGLKPAVKSAGVSSSDFPTDAQRYGFSGWVKTEFNVATDGRTLEPRVLFAYPPIVFNSAGEQITKGMRFTRTYRPEAGVACAAQQQAITFSIAQN